MLLFHAAAMSLGGHKVRFALMFLRLAVVIFNLVSTFILGPLFTLGVLASANLPKYKF